MEVGLAVPRRTRGVVDLIDAQLYADLSEHLLNGGEVVGVVAVAGEGEAGHLEAVAEATLRQERLGLGEIVGIERRRSDNRAASSTT